MHQKDSTQTMNAILDKVKVDLMTKIIATDEATNKKTSIIQQIHANKYKYSTTATEICYTDINIG